MDTELTPAVAPVGRARFSIDGWRAAGYTGFVPLLALAPGGAPARPGVYVVLRPSVGEPVFEASSGGWFKGKDPNVSMATLSANWVAATQTVYIGKAGTSLAERLKAYRSFGHGRPAGHWGGRMIWQLADRQQLLACWTTIADDDPAHEESRLIAAFRDVYGDRPFANLKD
jgi:hypothetical protein